MRARQIENLPPFSYHCATVGLHFCRNHRKFCHLTTNACTFCSNRKAWSKQCDVCRKHDKSTSFRHCSSQSDHQSASRPVVTEWNPKVVATPVYIAHVHHARGGVSCVVCHMCGRVVTTDPPSLPSFAARSNISEETSRITEGYKMIRLVHTQPVLIYLHLEE